MIAVAAVITIIILLTVILLGGVIAFYKRYVMHDQGLIDPERKESIDVLIFAHLKFKQCMVATSRYMNADHECKGELYHKLSTLEKCISSLNIEYIV